MAKQDHNFIFVCIFRLFSLCKLKYFVHIWGLTFLLNSEVSHKLVCCTLEISSFSSQQSSPYRIEDGQYSPKPSGSPMMAPSPTSPADFSSQMGQHQLNRSYDSSASSSSFEPSQSPLPEIVVCTAAETTIENNNTIDACPLDSKIFADHFNLDDLSSSFRSLYKSVFQSSLTTTSPNGNQITKKDVLLNSKSLLIFSHIFLWVLYTSLSFLQIDSTTFSCIYFLLHSWRHKFID